MIIPCKYLSAKEFINLVVRNLLSRSPVPLPAVLIMELQKTLGQLTQAVNTLTKESKEQGKKLDKISHQVFAAKVTLSIAGGALLLFSGLIGKLWDVMIPLLPGRP